MQNLLHVVAETAQFLRDAEAAGVSESERLAIVDSVASNPVQGVEIQGSGGVRKFRVAGRGKGKSGGYRVILAYFGEEIPVYLLALLSKGERENFSDREVVGFKSMTNSISRSWRERKAR